MVCLCGGLAQSVECVVSNDEAPGSKPGFSTRFCRHKLSGQVALVLDNQHVTCWGISSIGRVRALQARGTGIETRILHFFWNLGSEFASTQNRRFAVVFEAALAQLGERQTEDLKVPGSIPGGGIFAARCLERRCACDSGSQTVVNSR
jgi:hypothetical protein